MTSVYVRDSLLIDLTADEKTQRGAGSTGIDQIGKVFIVVARDERKCLICDCVFTRQGAAEHADVVCHRVMSVKAVLNSKLVLSIE